MSNNMGNIFPTHTSSYDTFHGVRDHKKKKNIHIKVACKVKASLEEKEKEMDVPIMVGSQECEDDFYATPPSSPQGFLRWSIARM